MIQILHIKFFFYFFLKFDVRHIFNNSYIIFRTSYTIEIFQKEKSE